MAQSQTAAQGPSKLEKTGAIIALTSFTIFFVAATAAAVVGATGAITRPDGLLLETAFQQKTEEPDRPKITAVPKQEMQEPVRIKVLMRDGTRIHERIAEVAEEWGGHQMAKGNGSQRQRYAVPGSAAAWLTELDVRHGENAYAKLNDPPRAQAAANDPLTAVTIVVEPNTTGRPTFKILLWTMGAIAGTALLTTAIGVGIVLPLEKTG